MSPLVRATTACLQISVERPAAGSDPTRETDDLPQGACDSRPLTAPPAVRDCHEGGN